MTTTRKMKKLKKAVVPVLSKISEFDLGYLSFYENEVADSHGVSHSFPPEVVAVLDTFARLPRKSAGPAPWIVLWSDKKDPSQPRHATVNVGMTNGHWLLYQTLTLDTSSPAANLLARTLRANHQRMPVGVIPKAIIDLRAASEALTAQRAVYYTAEFTDGQHLLTSKMFYGHLSEVAAAPTGSTISMPTTEFDELIKLLPSGKRQNLTKTVELSEKLAKKIHPEHLRVLRERGVSALITAENRSKHATAADKYLKIGSQLDYLRDSDIVAKFSINEMNVNGSSLTLSTVARIVGDVLETRATHSRFWPEFKDQRTFTVDSTGGQPTEIAFDARYLSMLGAWMGILHSHHTVSFVLGEDALSPVMWDIESTGQLMNFVIMPYRVATA